MALQARCPVDGVVLLGYWCGLRFGELTAVRRSGIDVHRSRIRIERTAQPLNGKVFVGPPKTSAGRRTVPVPRSIMGELVEFTNVHTDQDAEG